MFFMARKSDRRKVTGPTIVLSEPYKLYTKYHDKVFVPMEAVDRRWQKLNCRTYEDCEARNNARFETMDGKKVRILITAIIKNADGSYDGQFEEICQELYGMSWHKVRMAFESRFPRMDPYWCIIELSDYYGKQ